MYGEALTAEDAAAILSNEKATEIYNRLTGEAVAAEYGVESILDPENGYYGLVKDVYKRQGVIMADYFYKIGNHVARRHRLNHLGCLLYTSRCV